MSTKVSPRKILVAGGAGFVGSHLVDLLLAQGHRVTVLDSYVTSSKRNLAHVEHSAQLRIVRADVREPFRGRFDDVYHLASPASPDDYTDAPVHTLLTNALGTWHMLEVARRSAGRFLLASTSEVYGDPLEHPQRETYAGNVDPIGPRSAYDEGKRFAEAITIAYAREHALNVRVVRIFNTYGPRMRPTDGRMPSSFISNAIRKRPIEVHGNGQQTRSLCYVGDTARGLIAAMKHGRTGEVYNIGRPDELTVLEFARTVQRATGSRSPIRLVRWRPQDIHRRRPDIAKAKRELGWSPMTSLEDGLRETVAWFKTELSRPGAKT